MASLKAIDRPVAALQTAAALASAGSTSALILPNAAPGHEVLDSQSIWGGSLLDGTGAAWIDDVKFEAVDKSVAPTGMVAGAELAAEPTNLGFEK